MPHCSSTWSSAAVAISIALSQGSFGGGPPGSPAAPNTGSLVKVNGNGTFSTVVDGLDRPTSVEFIRNTAYIVTLTGEIWKVENVSGPPHGHGCADRHPDSEAATPDAVKRRSGDGSGPRRSSDG